MKMNVFFFSVVSIKVTTEVSYIWILINDVKVGSFLHYIINYLTSSK